MEAKPEPEFIVAEVSKNWHLGYSDSPVLVSQLFEGVIETNRKRGYILHTFSLSQLMTGPEEMNETIIAVFRKES
jgi:hypothetical protein